MGTQTKTVVESVMNSGYAALSLQIAGGKHRAKG